MNIKSIVFLNKRLALSFICSLLIHILFFSILKNSFLAGGFESDASNQTFQFRLVDTTSKLGQAPNFFSRSTKNEELSKEKFSERRQPNEHDVQERPVAVGSSDVDAALASEQTRVVVTPLVSPTSVGGGLFTRHLRRSAYHDSHSAVSYPIEKDPRNTHRLSVFSSQISPTDGLDCELLNEAVLCQHGYQMNIEKQAEWRYLYAHNLLSNKIKIKADYLHKEK